MKRLLIVGAGGFGREVLAWAKQLPEAQQEWNFGGFLDDDASALGDRAYDERVVGTVREYAPQDGDVLALAIGSPAAKLAVASDLKKRGAAFTSIVHPTALLSRNVVVGEGCILCPYVVVSADARLGDFVHVNLHTTVGHDVVVGEGSTLSAHCDLTGGVKLGRGVFMGSGARIIPGVSVADFARIGAGSVVLTAVRSDVTVFGIPAKVVS